jgi:hypothetical protein
MDSLGTGEGRNGNESEIGLGVVSDGLQECRELVNDLIVSVQGERGSIWSATTICVTLKPGID